MVWTAIKTEVRISTEERTLLMTNCCRQHFVPRLRLPQVQCSISAACKSANYLQETKQSTACQHWLINPTQCGILIAQSHVALFWSGNLITARSNLFRHSLVPSGWFELFIYLTSENCTLSEVTRFADFFRRIHHI